MTRVARREGGHGTDVLGPGDAPERAALPRPLLGLAVVVSLVLGGGVATADRLRSAEASRPLLAVTGLSSLEAGPGPDAVAVELELVNRGAVTAHVTAAGGSFAGLRRTGAEPALPREGDGRLLRVRPGEHRSLRVTYRVTDCTGLRRDRVDLPVTVRLSDGREEELRLEMPTADGPRRRLPVNGRGPLRRDLSPPREWQVVLAQPSCRGSLPALDLLRVVPLEAGRDGAPRVRADLRLSAGRTPLRVTAVRGSTRRLSVEATGLQLGGLDSGGSGRVSFDFRVDCGGEPLPGRYLVAVVVLDDDLRTVRTLHAPVTAGAAPLAAARAALAGACP